MEVNVDRFTGASLVNTIRQTVLTRLPCTRPIAFKVGATSNVLTINDSVEEDMTEFISKVCANEFVNKSEKELVVFSKTVSGVLNVTDLSSDDLAVEPIGPMELLHMSSENEVTIYFRNGAGKYTAAENVEFLKKHGVDANEVTTIVSRHSPVSMCSCEKKQETTTGVVYEIMAMPKVSLDGDGLIEQAIQIVKSDLNDLV